MKLINFLFLIYISSVFWSCAQAKRIPLPFGDFDSCIAIDIPPVTLTPARTAAEKQLIGEHREIEENGWLIASAKNTAESDASLQTAGSGEIRSFFRDAGILEFYNDLVLRYKSEGLLGENSSGRLEIVPAAVSGRKGRMAGGDEAENAARVAREVNEARARALEYVKKSREDEEILRPFFSVRPGDWKKTRNGEWIREK